MIWLKNRIALLESELDEQRQACQAHASHSAFLAGQVRPWNDIIHCVGTHEGIQISQTQRENLLKLKIKQQTIQRLREELIAAKRASGYDLTVRDGRTSWSVSLL